MANTDLTRFLVAWINLQKAVNRGIPTATDRIWAARDRMRPPSGPKGPTSQ